MSKPLFFLQNTIIALAVSFWIPYACSINSIFLPYVESNALEKSTNICFALTNSMIQWIGKINGLIPPKASLIFPENFIDNVYDCKAEHYKP